jgi:putative transposase
MGKEALMPWKETCAMNERILMIAEFRKGELSVAELCRRYGVSRRTGHKWLARYEEEGVGGLRDRSHATHDCTHRVIQEVADEVLAVRGKHPTWGPKKIRWWLDQHKPQTVWPALSTIGGLIDAAGLTARRRPRRKAPPSAPFASCLAANDTWAIDFKGWFRTGDGKRCDPLTLTDAFSRYLLRCQAVERCDFLHVWPIIEGAFREFGLPKTMRSDNGPPFASVAAGGLSKLSVRLIKTGVMPERIALGKPQQNGRHERFHRTLQGDTIDPPAANRRAQQRRFDAFCDLYNNERPHESLKQTPPGWHYEPSPRCYTGKLREPEYDDDRLVRRVRTDGSIRWHSDTVYISEVLASEPVGCKEKEDGTWSVHYGPIELGTIVTKKGRARLKPISAPVRRQRTSQPPG